MRKLLCSSLCLALTATLVASAAFARNTGSGKLANYQPHQTESPAPPVGDPIEALTPVGTGPGTTVLGYWDFDDGAACTRDGWTSIDVTGQLGVFWHVDDFAGLAGYAPIAGAQSMWCGSRVDPGGPLCGYLTLPGYGNLWNQAICWVGCLDITPVTPATLDITMAAAWDSEPAYDWTQIEWKSDGCGGPTTTWTLGYGGKGVWDGTSSSPALPPGGTIAIPTPGPAGIELRIRFTADGAWSDEDALFSSNGAVYIDNLTVEGVLEDFEGEAVGSTTASNLVGCNPPGFGTYDDVLHTGDPGLAIPMVDEDPCLDVTGCVFYFWNGSPDDYGCGGFPLQVAVPFGPINGVYLTNEIWSPEVPLVGAGNIVNLEFWVYRDLPLDNLVFYVFHISQKIAGCLSGGLDFNFVYYGPDKDWINSGFAVGPLLDLANATDLQVRLGAWDMCAVWCSTIGTGACHSHAPLFDNVTLYRVGGAGPVWSTRDFEFWNDNFPGDGTATGTVRADNGLDFLPSDNANIHQGDSCIVFNCGDPVLGLDTAIEGGPAAVYCYVSVVPFQAGKSGAVLQADPRWPFKAVEVINGKTWTKIRMDTTFAALDGSRTNPVPDRWCVDIKDDLLTPPDRLDFFFEAVSAGGALRSFLGEVVVSTKTLAARYPKEMQCLPGPGEAAGGDILYVDGGGFVPQYYHDRAFQALGILGKVDRYDVRGPTSAVSNRLGTNGTLAGGNDFAGLAVGVKNISAQLVGTEADPIYRKIIWNTANFDVSLGDGSGTPEKTDDYRVLTEFLDLLENPGGVYLSGDDLSAVLSGFTGAAAVEFKTVWCTYSLTNADHTAAGFGFTPTVLGFAGGCFDGDTFIAYGGCPIINDFDVLTPTGTATAEATYGAPAIGNTNSAIIAQKTLNSQTPQQEVGVILQGFSFHYITDSPATDLDGADVMQDALLWLGNVTNDPVGTGPVARTSLGQNYPNPFNPQTVIPFALKERGHVTIKVYNVAGQLVRTLLDDAMAAGSYPDKVKWDGRDGAGQSVSSGVYFYKLVTKDFSQTKKMILLK